MKIMQSDKLFAQSRQAVQARRAGGTSRLVPCGAGKGWFRLLWIYLPEDKASGLGEAVAPSLGGRGGAQETTWDVRVTLCAALIKSRVQNRKKENIWIVEMN